MNKKIKDAIKHRDTCQQAVWDVEDRLRAAQRDLFAASSGLAFELAAERGLKVGDTASYPGLTITIEGFELGSRMNDQFELIALGPLDSRINLGYPNQKA
ncbi:MAG: hypothetical protein IPO08_22850 [Xanthomonadales bacterium]|nr:hypothetical protein [Xanthomonadales bacterium]